VDGDPSPHTVSVGPVRCRPKWLSGCGYFVDFARVTCSSASAVFSR